MSDPKMLRVPSPEPNRPEVTRNLNRAMIERCRDLGGGSGQTLNVSVRTFVIAIVIALVAIFAGLAALRPPVQ